MATSPITSLQIGWETVTDIILGGFKTTEDGDCSHEIKRYLFLGKKAMSNLNSLDITFLTEVHLVKPMVFPVVMYGYELDYKES